MPNIKHGLSGTRDYQREKLREWREKQTTCECGRPASVRYMGSKVCAVCYSRQKHRDLIVDERERWKALRERRRLAAQKAAAARWDKYGRPFEAPGLNFSTLTVDEKATLVLDSLQDEKRTVS